MAKIIKGSILERISGKIGGIVIKGDIVSEAPHWTKKSLKSKVR